MSDYIVLAKPLLPIFYRLFRLFRLYAILFALKMILNCLLINAKFLDEMGDFCKLKRKHNTFKSQT